MSHQKEAELPEEYTLSREEIRTVYNTVTANSESESMRLADKQWENRKYTQWTAKTKWAVLRPNQSLQPTPNSSVDFPDTPIPGAAEFNPLGWEEIRPMSQQISAEFYDWFNGSSINRGHLIPCWLAWEQSRKKPIVGVPGKVVCNAPMNCECGYQTKPVVGLNDGG